MGGTSGSGVRGQCASARATCKQDSPCAAFASCTYCAWCKKMQIRVFYFLEAVLKSNIPTGVIKTMRRIMFTPSSLRALHNVCRYTGEGQLNLQFLLLVCVDAITHLPPVQAAKAPEESDNAKASIWLFGNCGAGDAGKENS